MEFRLEKRGTLTVSHITRVGLAVVFTFLESKLWIACIGFEVALCIALFRRRLASRYPWFLGLVLVNSIRDVLLALVSNVGNDHYPRLWILTLPVLMFVQVATVAEAYDKFTDKYPGLERFASYLLRGCVALLIVISCVSGAWSFHPFTESAMQSVLFTYRYLTFVLAGCLALPTLFFSRFPKPDKQAGRNTRVHLCMLIAYFSVYSISFLLVNVLGTQETTITAVNVLMLGTLCCLYALWTLLLTPEGEISVPWPTLDRDLAVLIDQHGEAASKRGHKLEAWMGIDAQQE